MSRPNVESARTTFEHIERVRAKRDRLEVAQREAEAQLLESIRRAWELQEIDLEGLYELYNQFRDLSDPGYGKRWNATMPISYGSLRHAVQDFRYRQQPRWKPNGPHGSYTGTWPLEENAPRPMNGQSVVYVLYDAKTTPCYVGSTDQLYYRLKAHWADGKEFEQWVAFPCDDREAAYALEDRLLKEHQPYLNKRAGR